MTARRPNVPRAGRPSPAAEERPAPGAAKGQTPAGSRAGSSPTDTGSATGTRGASHVPAPSRPAQPRPAGSGQRKPSPPRAAGPSATKDPRSMGSSGTRDARAASGAAGTTPPRTARPATGRSTPASPSEARAAERSQLAGSIRRGRLGSKRAESVIEPAEEATPIPAKSFSGRLLALAVVLIAVIVLLAPSVSRYLQQQAELDALRADIAQQQQEQADYQSELARWDDPAFVRQQARERIFLVMPGETRYLVKGGDGIEESTGEGSAPEPADLPWVDSLWSSVARAATD
ncbi:FtsB family cell division protein [Arthrobacter burdickii]|uniref:Septum formation initiator family protein n=1 Tax=Arthrobacter burdickii TaxID=3035920 RepID=A0ABT8K6Q7_9MICC|nr:septum formation initiator family protein [Arthrobacter burdickii]MDN4612496.1 septum formation initiator family protein [Arthrobacter burdickii]